MVPERQNNQNIPQTGGSNSDTSSPQIISDLTAEDLQLGERELRLMEALFDWGERSAKTHWVLGKPYGS